MWQLCIHPTVRHPPRALDGCRSALYWDNLCGLRIETSNSTGSLGKVTATQLWARVGVYPEGMRWWTHDHLLLGIRRVSLARQSGLRRAVAPDFSAPCNWTERFRSGDVGHHRLFRIYNAKTETKL